MSTRAEDKKADIVKAAEKRFIKHGLYKTTMEEIARDVRIGKSTIYHYFASKEELFYVTVEKQRELYMQAVKAAFDAPDREPAGKWADYLKIKAMLAKDFRLLYNVMILCVSGNSNTIEDDLFLKFFGEELKLLAAQGTRPAGEDSLSRECLALLTFAFPLMNGLHLTINEKTTDYLHGMNCTDAVTALFGKFLHSAV